MFRKSVAIAAALSFCLMSGVQAAGPAKVDFGGGHVNHARQMAADAEPGTWMSDGRTFSQQRYSPLDLINQGNVAKLGLAWYGDIDTQNGQEATPVVVDGVMYITTAWSMVKAYDAKTGRKMWEYDPKVDRAKGRNACCDVVNRGVSVWEGKVYLGALDGRLIALDSKTGDEIWSEQTTDPNRVHTITQVPRIIKGKVIIGNAGAEYDVRGYVSAYDANTGKMLWRFYTVPGDPSKPYENEAMKMAAATWKGDQYWKLGGGATAWDSILYDPQSNLVYFGTGNGLAWAQETRSPGGGDNLFVSSVIALNPDTGKMAWYFQETPGDEWDYDNTNPLMTADLVIGGKKRHVLMQAPKQAFFYIWDAKTGELLSANQFAPQNWALGIDLKTGRPNVNPVVRYSSNKSAAIVYPGALGAHNWHPMSFSPRTGLVYIPITESVAGYTSADNFEYKPNANNVGLNNGSAAVTALFDKPGAPKRGNNKSYIMAWDPVTGKEAWRVDNKVYGASGTMVTAADIVFSGNHDGDFAAYDAKSGKRLWAARTQARTVAAPSTYTINGEQYVAVVVGARGLPDGQAQTNFMSNTNARILVYKLGGTAALPTAAVGASAAAASTGEAGAGRGTAGATVAANRLNPPLFTGSNEDYLDGEVAYGKTCAICHGDQAVADKGAPDLRYSMALNSLTDWTGIVIGGAKVNGGMPAFRTLTPEAVATIRHYVIRRANFLKDEQARAGR
ncbi:PQQ-dependent methanol/ethanol family dehydrogenase [soil metagenome]